MDIVDPYNINGPDFNMDMYLTKMLGKTPLSDLMTMEQEYYKQIQALDGEMQTLVYENYNKFIKASETIRQMKFDLLKMEGDMSGLEQKMVSIRDFSSNIYSTFQDNREQIVSLSATHTLLKKLQFLFSLPTSLQASLDRLNYAHAVKTYNKAQKVLGQYLKMQSFQGIEEEVNVIMEGLKVTLRSNLHSKQINTSKLTEYVDLLLQLGEPADQLCDEFLSQGRAKLNEDLEELQLHIQLQQDFLSDQPSLEENMSPMDILEFVDLGCNKFLSNISLFLNCYREMFIHPLSSPDPALHTKIDIFVQELMRRYFMLIEERVKLEPNLGDNVMLVRALDRFYRRLQAMNKILQNDQFLTSAEGIILTVVEERCRHCSLALQHHLARCVTDIRHALAVPEPEDAAKLLARLETSLMERLKATVYGLQAFVQPEVTFAMRAQFCENFALNLVREGIVVGFFRHVTHQATELTSTVDLPSPALLLIFTKLCLNMESPTGSISRLLELVDEIFLIDDQSKLTTVAQLCVETRTAAQRFLDHFVKVQGMSISQMVRKSMEAKEWMKCLEPASVRAVMKRLVEEVTGIDGLVGQLFEEGQRREQSSDSSRRTFPYSNSSRLNRSSWSVCVPNSFDSNLLSNIQKLFVERIEIFGSVEFSKMSVMTGIIKISLKTLLECVRLQTFTKHGVQQIQVDTHYLYLYLWKFVTDENVIHALLDEIVGSAIHRCLDPQLMEPGIVETICDRN